jgi:hypothetical protein
MGGFAGLLPRPLGRELLTGPRQGLGDVLPHLLDGVPALEREPRLHVPLSELGANDPLSLTGGFLRVGVEKDAGAVPGHDHPIAEAPPFVRLEPNSGEPLDELGAVTLVVQVNGQAKVLGHAREA